jgi:hypothetical protein
MAHKGYLLRPQYDHFNKAHSVFFIPPGAAAADAPGLLIFFPGINFFPHQPGQQNRAGVTAHPNGLHSKKDVSKKINLLAVSL